MATLDPKILNELKRAMEEERDHLKTSLGLLAQAEVALSESQDLESGAGGGQADVASDYTEQTLDVSLERSERERLLEVEAALRRVADGTYGTCEGCGQAIDPERLRAIPWTRYCIDCANNPRRQRRASTAGRT